MTYHEHISREIARLSRGSRMRKLRNKLCRYSARSLNQEAK